jgi:hypothetical protein
MTSVGSSNTQANPAAIAASQTQARPTVDREIARRLHRASLMIGEVDVTPARGGWTVTLYLNPLMVKARAGQQGLTDPTVPAAARSPRVQRALADVVAQINATLPRDAQITGHAVARQDRPCRAVP